MNGMEERHSAPRARGKALACAGSPLWWSAVLVLLMVMAVELFVPARHQAQTPDEANHMLGGVRYWKFGDFGTNPEHPPLAKLVAALPVLSVPSPPVAPFTQFFKMENFESGAAFLYTHDADNMLWRARAAVSVFSFALALLVLAAGSEMFGGATGLLALLVFAFEPTLLAHGAMVTTDMAEACCFFGSVYAFYRWTERPTLFRLSLVCLAAGLALAAKHSGAFLFPVLLAMGFTESFTATGAAVRARRMLRIGMSLAVVAAAAYTILWAFYGFRYQARPGPLEMVPTLADYAAGLQSAPAQAVVRMLAAWHVLPEAYLFGIVDILVAAKRDPMFLLGTDYPTGRWFYFPVAILIKGTLGFLALLFSAPFLKDLWREGRWRKMAYLLVPALMYLGASLASSMDIGIRHVLPVFPFFVLVAAASAVSLSRRGRWGKIAAAGLVLLHVVSSALVFPYYLTYSNEAWGGPTRTYRVLTDSNVDWNQGLRAVKSYLDRNGIHDCLFAHYGWDVAPAYYKIPCKPLPDGLSHHFGQPLPPVGDHIKGTILISATEADGDYWGPGDLNPYAQFLYRKPDAIIANSILVFNGAFDVPVLSAMTHVSQAQQLASQQRWNEALDEARTAIDLAPNSAETHAALGSIQLEMHDTEQARLSFQQALAFARQDHLQFQRVRILKIPSQFDSP